MGVQAIIDNAILTAQNKANLADAYTGVAMNIASAPPVIAADALRVDPVRAPNVAIPSRATGIDLSVFDSVNTKIIEDLSGRFLNFLNEYFPPNRAMMEAVESWITNAITNGGTGVNATVEGRIWQRDRDRITREASASIEQASAQWASRGFPLPPGALVSAVQSIEQSRQTAVAAVSREAAIKAFETEVENVRFAITQAVDYRTKAISAAGDYIRALAVAPQLASSMAGQSSDAQARLISAASGFYNAQINAQEASNRVAMFSSEGALKARISNQEATMKYAGLRTDSAMAAAQSLGTQAAAALNAVSATAQEILSE